MSVRTTDEPTTVKPISPLRRRMIEDMTIRNMSPATQRSYIHAVQSYSRHFGGRSPDRLGLEDVRAYHLASKGVAWATLNQVVCALRFFYGVTLREDEVPERIPYARKPRTLPEVLSREEVVRFLEAVPNLKSRVALTTAYATGMRVSEVVAVEVRNIDSNRKVIRIEHGKGAKDRYVMLSEQLVGILRGYWVLVRPKRFMFPGRVADTAIDVSKNYQKSPPLFRGKSNRLMLKGALVTIDAMGTQIEIARKIMDGGGDYCLALKANRPLLHAEVERFFADSDANTVHAHTTVDGDHGRIEERRHVVCHDVEWLFSDRRYADEPRFPGLVMIGMVETRVQRGGTVAHERRYDLSSARLDTVTFARAVRAHWGVENRLHCVLDVVFHDDHARLRTGHGPENMVIVRHMGMNLLRSTKATASLKVQRKKAAWNPGYLGNVLRGAA